MFTDFEKFHPPQNKNPPSTFIDFLDFFPPSTPRLLDLCTSLFLFQPPRLLKR